MGVPVLIGSDVRIQSGRQDPRGYTLFGDVTMTPLPYVGELREPGQLPRLKPIRHPAKPVSGSVSCRSISRHVRGPDKSADTAALQMAVFDNY